MRHPNPLISGFNPDPSVVRVGDEFFLATSTFEYLPGIPIYRSSDFDTWERIGHVATRPGQLAVEQVPTAGGAWAPTIRHRDGVFHLVITDAMGRGMLHFTATDAAGPWSDGDLILTVDGSGGIDGIDPDIAWDADGTVYITSSGLILGGPDVGKHLGIQQVRVDLDTHRATEEPRSLWSGSGSMFPEAPHLYEVDGRWYLLIAEGGTERGHGISIARGDSPVGPFEAAAGNPLVSARSTDRPIQNTGHGDLVIGPEGEWLVVLLGVRPRSMTRAFSALGRETFVTTARWVDGWLEIDPVQLAPRPGSSSRDDFDDAEFASDWIAVRRLPAAVGSLTERPGRLTLHADGSPLDDPVPVFIGRRQEHLTATARIGIDVSEGVGGLAVRYDERFHVGITAGDGRLDAHAVLAGIRQEWSVPFDGTEVELVLRARRPSGEGGVLARTSDLIELAAVVDGAEQVLATIDGRFLSSEVTESFTGRVVGPYAVSGTVAIDWFAYAGDDE